MRRRLFWLVNDFLYRVTFGRVDLDDVLRLRDDIAARLVDGDRDLFIWLVSLAFGVALLIAAAGANR